LKDFGIGIAPLVAIGVRKKAVALSPKLRAGVRMVDFDNNRLPSSIDAVTLRAVKLAPGGSALSRDSPDRCSSSIPPETEVSMGEEVGESKGIVETSKATGIVDRLEASEDDFEVSEDGFEVVLLPVDALSVRPNRSKNSDSELVMIWPRKLELVELLGLVVRLLV
jgi:hypothetical protein